jgi:hypothetical protein
MRSSRSRLRRKRKERRSHHERTHRPMTIVDSRLTFGDRYVRLISRAFSGRLHKDFLGWDFEIFEQGRTQPSFHFPLWPAIPIASVFGSSPDESGGVARKRPCREDDFESARGLRDVFRQHIQNVVGAADERFPHEAGSCVIEDPYSFQPVGENDRHGVHFLPAAAPPASQAMSAKISRSHEVIQQNHTSTADYVAVAKRRSSTTSGLASMPRARKGSVTTNFLLGWGHFVPFPLICRPPIRELAHLRRLSQNRPRVSLIAMGWRRCLANRQQKKER